MNEGKQWWLSAISDSEPTINDGQSKPTANTHS